MSAMLAIKQQQAAPKLTPNILPCTIKHDGVVNTPERYWNPKREDDGSSTTYFRGRKLTGKTVKVPEGYTGVLLEKSAQQVAQRPQIQSRLSVQDETDSDALDEQPGIETHLMDQGATFDTVVIWGHEDMPPDDDPYAKGIEEWMAFAEAMHSHEATTDSR